MFRNTVTALDAFVVVNLMNQSLQYGSDSSLNNIHSQPPSPSTAEDEYKAQGRNIISIASLTSIYPQHYA